MQTKTRRRVQQAADHNPSHEEQKERDNVEIPLSASTTTAEDDTSVAPNDDEGEREGEKIPI